MCINFKYVDWLKTLSKFSLEAELTRAEFAIEEFKTINPDYTPHRSMYHAIMFIQVQLERIASGERSAEGADLTENPPVGQLEAAGIRVFQSKG